MQFLTLSGNWTRALTQLKSWLALKPQAKPTVTLLEQCIQGELQRAQVMAGERRPAMPEAQWPWLTTLAAALSESDERAHALRLEALEQAQASAGQWTLENDETQIFEWLMDGDARLGPVCETLVNGRYFWLPFSAIAEIRFQAPASVTDLVWRHALVRLTDGTEQVCQIRRVILLPPMPLTPLNSHAPPSGCRSMMTALCMKGWGRKPGSASKAKARCCR